MLTEESYTFSLMEQLGVDNYTVLPQIFIDALQWQFPMDSLDNRDLCFCWALREKPHESETEMGICSGIITSHTTKLVA